MDNKVVSAFALHEFLDLVKDGSAPLSSECAKNDAEHAGFLRFVDFLLADSVHPLGLVHFACERLGVRVELEVLQMAVSDHCTLDVESTIADKYHCVPWAGIGEVWRCTTENFSFRPWLTLG